VKSPTLMAFPVRNSKDVFQSGAYAVIEVMLAHLYRSLR
jgi:hypothetical protein